MSPSAEPPAPLPLRTLRALWAKLVGAYGERWTRAYGDSPERFEHERPTGQLTDAGATWAQGLAGLGRAELARGVGRVLLSASPWLPTLPEFRALALGIPTLAQVQLVLARRLDQDEEVAAFCRLVWRFIDSYRFARADVTTADRIVRDAYELAREYRMALGELPAAPVAAIAQAEPPRPTKASEETARAHMARIAELLRMHEAVEDLPGAESEP